MFSKLRLLLLLVALGISLAACSSTRIAYGFLDWALGWHIEKYVSLNHEQDAIAKQAIDEFHNWHRRTQLPLYTEYLRGLKTRLTSGDISSEQVHAETDQLQIFIDTSIAELLPLMVELASSFSDEQTREIQENLKEEREEYKEDYVEISDEKRYEKREKQLKKHLERLLGSLTKPQKEGLKTWARSVEPYEQLTLKQQAQWARQAEAALKKRDDKELLEQNLRKLMFYHAENWGEEAEQVIDTNQEITFEFIADVLNSMTAKQKRHLEKTLDDYIRDFEILASRSEEEPGS